MKKIIAILAAGTALAASAPAFAQDGTPAEAFSGLRVEGIVGYDKIRTGSTEDIDTNSNIKQSISGVEYGAVVGYDIAVGTNMTLGAEAEITESSASRDYNNDEPTVFNLGNVNAGRQYYVGTRAGFAVGPSTLLYVKGGYTNARFNLQGSNGTVNLRQRLDTDGWRAGAGLEQKVGKNAYIKLEYRYSNYARGEFDFNGETPDSSNFELDTDRHNVMAGFGVRF